jgi:hypothetical protein
MGFPPEILPVCSDYMISRKNSCSFRRRVSKCAYDRNIPIYKFYGNTNPSKLSLQRERETVEFLLCQVSRIRITYDIKHSLYGTLIEFFLTYLFSMIILNELLNVAKEFDKQTLVSGNC